MATTRRMARAIIVSPCFIARRLCGLSARSGGSSPLASLLPSPLHEIEVAALVGLHVGLVEHSGVAAPRLIGCCGRLQCGAPTLQLGGIDQQLDAALVNIQSEH